jgi:predicted AAA+ superfamily ATPase
VLAGGFPEALARKTWSRRQEWHAAHLDAMMKRDIRDVAQIDQIRQVPRLMRSLSLYAGQLTNYSAIGGEIGLSHVTTQKYVGVLENMCLIATLPAWHTTKLKRVAKTPKLHFVDSGLLASLTRLTPEKVAADRTQVGPILETFVYGKLAKLMSWSESGFQLFHFRDRERHEVDFVIEIPEGGIIGLEVKAAATVTAGDFSGLRHLADAVGRRFVAGVVRHDHGTIAPFGDRLFAAPIAALWH